MIHPDTELFDAGEPRGRGVRATARIPAGTLTWALCALDRVISPAALQRLGTPYHALVEHFAYRDHEGDYVLCWDAGRYMNHSCRPNTRGLGRNAQIAVRDIEVGEEITCDYGECNLDAPLACACGSRDCRGEIRAEDLQLLADEWDREVGRAVAQAPRVDQPLRPFWRDAETLVAALEGRAPPPSIRCLAFPRAALIG